MSCEYRLQTSERGGPNSQSTRWVVLGVALAIQTVTSIVAAALPVLLPLVKAEFTHVRRSRCGGELFLCRQLYDDRRRRLGSGHSG